MNKQRARQLYELADRLSKLDVNTLSEEQRQQRSSMIAKLQEEVRTIKEFAPDAGDGGEEETLRKYARMWYNGDDATQQQVEQILDRMGWEIGELESEEGGAFVVQSGDENGDSYIGFTVPDLTEDFRQAASPTKIISADDRNGVITVVVQANDGTKKSIANDNPNYINRWLMRYGLTLPRSITSKFVGVHEDVNGEYDDEAGMAKGSLQTMSRAVTGLMDTIQQGDDLPEWCQEKLSLAEDYLTTVWDYLLSQKEQGIEPKLEEASQRVDSLVTDALKIMRGSTMNDAIQALKTVLGDREFSSRRGHYNFYVRQMMDMYGQRSMAEGTADDINKAFNNVFDLTTANLQRVALLAMQGRQQEASSQLNSVIKGASPQIQKKIIDAVNNIKPVTFNGKIADSSTLDKSKPHKEWILKTFIPWVQSLLGQRGVTETKKPSPKLTPVTMKKTDPVSEEINTEAYERLQKVFAFKNYES